MSQTWKQILQIYSSRDLKTLTSHLQPITLSGAQRGQTIHFQAVTDGVTNVRAVNLANI